MRLYPLLQRPDLIFNLSDFEVEFKSFSNFSFGNHKLVNVDPLFKIESILSLGIPPCAQVNVQPVNLEKQHLRDLPDQRTFLDRFHFLLAFFLPGFEQSFAAVGELNRPPLSHDG